MSANSTLPNQDGAGGVAVPLVPPCNAQHDSHLHRGNTMMRPGDSRHAEAMVFFENAVLRYGSIFRTL